MPRLRQVVLLAGPAGWRPTDAAKSIGEFLVKPSGETVVGYLDVELVSNDVSRRNPHAILHMGEVSRTQLPYLAANPERVVS